MGVGHEAEIALCIQYARRKLGVRCNDSAGHPTHVINFYRIIATEQWQGENIPDTPVVHMKAWLQLMLCIKITIFILFSLIKYLDLCCTFVTHGKNGSLQTLQRYALRQKKTKKNF